VDSHHAVVDLSAIAVVLPPNTDRVVAALADARLIQTADRLGVGMIASDDLLAAIAQALFVPLDRFQEPL
jgi:hypothetical protein